jgi:hypothetical protein
LLAGLSRLMGGSDICRFALVERRRVVGRGRMVAMLCVLGVLCGERLS